MKTNREILMKFVSTQGYKRNSPDKNRPVNVIPSNEITMEDVDFPVKGRDNLGNEMVMQPGEDYTFPGDYVVETPVKQQGGNTDSTFEDVAEVFDPTGISSWDDVYRSYKQSGMSPETFIEVLGAIPILGKLGKASKAGIHLTKYSGLDKTLFNMLPKNNALSKTFNATSLVGRGSDAYQGYNQFGETRLMPTPVRNFNPPIKQEGGSLPIYVDSKNDPRYVSYMDSLNLYKKNITVPNTRIAPITEEEANFFKDEKTGIKPSFVQLYLNQKANGRAGHYGNYKKPTQEVIFEKPKTEYLSSKKLTNSELDLKPQIKQPIMVAPKTTTQIETTPSYHVRYTKDSTGKILNTEYFDFDGKKIKEEYKEGGENDREMVEGIADILTQVKDPANRKRIAKKMVADFKRENVKYNLQDFLSMSKVQMKEGGEKDRSIECSNCGWSWKESNAGSDPLDCHKCGGKSTGKLMMKSGGQHGGLDRWFAEKWVDVKTGEECGRQEGEEREGYPACRPSKRISEDTPKTASELSSSEKEKFKRTKTSSERIPYQHERKEDGGENYNYDMEYMKEGGNVPTNPELWSRAKAAAKSKYDVYPSAYANGYAAKWYKEKGGGWRKAQKGGTVEPIYVSDKNDPRLKAYTDSLNLYNQGLEPFMNFDNLTGKNSLKEYSKKNYIPGGEGAPVNREQILKEIGFINEELEWQDRPSLIKNANDRLALLNKSLETGVYPANLISSNQPINAIVYKKPVVPVKYNKSNEIVKEQSYNMDSKQIGSEEQKKMGGCMKCGGTKYEDGGAYSGYMMNPMEMMYQEGGQSMNLSNLEVVELAKKLGDYAEPYFDNYNSLSPVDKQRVAKSFQRFTGYDLNKIPYTSDVNNRKDSAEFLSGYNRGAAMSKNYPAASKTVFEQGLDPVFGVYGKGRSQGYFDNAKYQEGGEAEDSQEMQQGPEIEAAIGEMSNMIAQGEDPSNIYSMLIESGVPEEYAQGYLSEAMSDLEEDDMEEEDVPMDEEEMQEFEESSEEEESEEENEEETEMKRGGSIKIRPSRKGTFKAQATKMGMSVQEAAEYILRHKDEFTPLMVKKANFAKNFAKELGGEIYNLEKFKNGGGIPQRYRNLGFTRVGAKRRSTRPGKKWMVLAKKGDQYKVVHGGYKGMKDFTQHRDPKRRERFWNRMGGKNSAKATDPFSPLYWHKRFGTWQEGGGVYTGSYLYKAQTGGTLSYEQWLSQNMNRPDVMQNSQSPDYLVSLYQSEVQSTPSQTPAMPRMTRTSGSGMGAMEILDPMVPNADNPYDLTLPATPPISTQVGRLVAPPGWNAMNNTEDLSTSGTGVQNEPSKGPIFNLNNLRRKAGDIMLGSMGAFNQKRSKEDYEKEYKKRLQDTGNSDQRYNAYNPSNPFGNYTLNAGPGSNFALVTNTPMQDFGTRMSGARYGGTTSYKQGGEYYASNEEINMILAMGGEIEFLD